MALDEAGVDYMKQMVDFEPLQDLSESEVTEWATEKWGEFKSSEYWGDPDTLPFVSIFVRYMGDKVPELQWATQEATQVNNISDQA